MWLTFFGTDEPLKGESLINTYSKFKVMYKDIYNICLNTEKVIRKMENAKKFKPTKKQIVKVILIILLVIFFYWQNKGLVVTQYEYASEKVASELNGYKIVQVSDLHNATFGAKNKKLLKLIKDQKPDMIVVTGDVIDSSFTNIGTAVEFVKGAVEIAPVYYVTGNHEEWIDANEKESLLKQMEQVGAQILDNKSILLGDEEAGFWLVGLAEVSLQNLKLMEMTRERDMEKELVVLLAHEPQYIKHYSSANVDLIFSGHAHGGQFRLPFIGGIVAPDQGLFPEYTEGVHKEGKSTMIISRGLGNSVIPIRLFNRPEIVCVELKSQ